mgnify:CR=1 FL=1
MVVVVHIRNLVLVTVAVSTRVAVDVITEKLIDSVVMVNILVLVTGISEVDSFVRRLYIVLVRVDVDGVVLIETVVIVSVTITVLGGLVTCGSVMVTRDSTVTLNGTLEVIVTDFLLIIILDLVTVVGTITDSRMEVVEVNRLFLILVVREVSV